MKKRIIFISEALWIGGIETALVNLLNSLDYEQYDVTCLVVRDYTDMAGRITDKCRLLVADRDREVSFSEPYKHRRLYHLTEKPQHATKLRLLLWKMLSLLLKPIEMRLYSRYIQKCINGEKYDTAVIYSDRTAEIAVRAIDAEKFLMFYHHGAMRREYHDDCGYKKSEKIIAVSETLAEQLREFRPEYAEKITAINNLVDVEGIRKKAGESIETKFDSSKFNIVSCGRISKEKGLNIAAEAIAELIEQGYENIEWYVIGDGPDMNEFRSEISELGIENHVHLLGMKSNPYPYMAKATLLIQPSLFEGYSGAILEARIMSLPVLATYAASANQIENNVTGMLCDATAESFACALRELLDNPQMLKAFREILKQFNFEKQNDEIMEQIYSLLI